ncbi:Ras family Rab small GTP-binding protein [Theileria equi strain WA]|uniref:Ras family Rab small GTP-binding protein n=1 Tax=Theileria equi strain WA TaxID=1537102 RepID=L0B1E7_THEEQ|nr:Ras family Rab small GTP-binding protein [Theileria equi strain WA]AFZ81328.1 Ras family Rab small GTP-binding protein [Theileria equi strain WA]|eukprot:XP_004830994.1 Ras family Rab small GTP-binding protein [Theileria equi strain WA]
MEKRSYKTVLLGDASVGKSSFVVRLTRGEFSDNINSTIGGAFFNYTVRISVSSKNISGGSDDGSATHMEMNFEIWDTAGQERFKSILPMYYRKAACAIVILDVTLPQTLQHAAFWVNQIRVANNNETIIVLVANKIDLLGSNPETIQTLANAKAYAKEESLIFVETSAKTGQNIVHVFDLLAQEISENPSKWDKLAPKLSKKTLRVDEVNTNNLRSSCCMGIL